MFIDEQIVYNQLSVKESSIWSLLRASGYLKVVETKLILNRGRYDLHELRLPLTFIP